MSVAGGNLTRSPHGLVVDVTAGGEVSPRKWLARDGGRPGDELWVSGALGGARAGLEMFERGSGASGRRRGRGVSPLRHRRPVPRVRLGVALARVGAARAAIDLSDGLADAVRQLAAASGCGARVDADAVPIEPGCADLVGARRTRTRSWRRFAAGRTTSCCSRCRRGGPAACATSAARSPNRR